MLSVPLLRPDTRFRADSSSCHQLSPHQKQVAEGEQRKELGPVLGEAAVACLHMAKLAFNDTEGMLDPGPHLGDDAVGAFLKWMQIAALWGLAHDAPELARATERDRALGADISFVRPDRGLVAMQQRIPDLAVVQLGRRGLKAMCHAALGACANVGFHTEEPVIALFRGRHFGISRLGLVLGR